MNRCIVLIGAPCSGKSTIGKTMASNIGYKYISSGDIARKMAEEAGTMDKLNAGEMAPEYEMRNMIYKVLKATEKSVILDGFPRYIDQYHWLMENFKGVKFKFVYIDTPMDIINSRMKARNRSDDNAIMKRISYYILNTLQILDVVNKDDIIRIDNSDSNVINAIDNVKRRLSAW